MKKIYDVVQIEEEKLPSWNEGKWAYMDYTPWRGDKVPPARAQLLYHRERGFLVRMECMEENPRRIHTRPNSMVYEDSCMEFFVNFSPKTTPSYFNFEVNANGVLLCQFGPDRAKRRTLTEGEFPLPRVRAEQEGDRWRIEYWVSLSLIRALYGSWIKDSNTCLAGNFYKCGDKTDHPHYGAWSPLVNGEPNFHLPEQFGIFEFQTLPA